MKFGSLFSGIGGFDLALERAGMECAFQCEIDKPASRVLAKHWPDVARYEDVGEIGKHNLPAVDVLCGGFPCQDLSIAGKRAGLAGERSGLWWEFDRLIGELNPKWVIAENVPGLLSSNRGRDFALVLQSLVERGYGVCWRVLDAQYFGLAQRRRRVFIVASLGNGRATEVLFEREGVCWDSPAREKQGEGTAGCIAFEPGNLRRRCGAEPNEFVTGTLGAEKIGDTMPHIAGTIDRKTCGSDRGSQANETDFLVPVVLAHGQGNAEVVKDGSPSLTCNHEQPIVWDFHSQDGSYRPQGDTAPTVAATWGTGGNNMPFVGVRRLTPAECERLQGFPDGFTSGQADSQRYKQLGNAVAVPVVEWIAKRIANCER